MIETDVIITGAGPAGMTTALKLAGTGIKVAVIEKDTYPREKICGDALSGKVMNILRRLPGDAYSEFLSQVEKHPAWGISFIAPDMTRLDVPFHTGSREKNIAPVYLCKRFYFDKFLYEQCCKYDNINLYENQEVKKVYMANGRAFAETGNETYNAKMIIGADGHRSLLRKSLTTGQAGKQNTCLAVRAYYENVSGAHLGGFLELFFLKELLPGYLWIFPIAGNLFNVGLGMMQSHVIKRKINLSRLLEQITATHPQISPRFRDAKLVSKYKAHSLPLGTQKAIRSGERFLLLGDAASLVDPFSGEGIGNAMASGEVAGEMIRRCFREDRFDADFLTYYDRRIASQILGEFRYSKTLQVLGRSARIFNFFAKRAARDNELKDLLETILIDDRFRNRLKNPLFYVKLLFK
jgi:geranylgeranyl reductase family protein